jgi:hypothetical protein
MSQYDLKLSEAARDEGMSRAEAGSGEDWREHAREIVLDVARQKQEFTSDDIWLAGLEEPSEPRALGPVLARLKKEGAIFKTGRFVQTARVSRHATDIAVWGSTTYQP